MFGMVLGMVSDREILSPSEQLKLWIFQSNVSCRPVVLE